MSLLNGQVGSRRSALGLIGGSIFGGILATPQLFAQVAGVNDMRRYKPIGYGPFGVNGQVLSEVVVRDSENRAIDVKKLQVDGQTLPIGIVHSTPDGTVNYTFTVKDIYPSEGAEFSIALTATNNDKCSLDRALTAQWGAGVDVILRGVNGNNGVPETAEQAKTTGVRVKCGPQAMTRSHAKTFLVYARRGTQGHVGLTLGFGGFSLEYAFWVTHFG